MKVKKTVCLIDDDPNEHFIFKDAMTLMDNTIEVITSESPRIAFDSISKGKVSKPTVIFLDINMPVMNGWDCLRYLKSSPDLCTIPVIMYSKSTNEIDKILSAELGASGYISKVDSHDALCEVLKKAIKS